MSQEISMAEKTLPGVEKSQASGKEQELKKDIEWTRILCRRTSFEALYNRKRFNAKNRGFVAHNISSFYSLLHSHIFKPHLCL